MLREPGNRVLRREKPGLVENRRGGMRMDQNRGRIKSQEIIADYLAGGIAQPGAGRQQTIGERHNGVDRRDRAQSDERQAAAQRGSELGRFALDQKSHFNSATVLPYHMGPALSLCRAYLSDLLTRQGQRISCGARGG